MVAYGCEEEFLLSHDWYRTPVMRLHCEDDGLFSGFVDGERGRWAQCVACK